ncbi:MAG: flagellar hook-basal body complex protein [Planctomycetales bacterium]|nr:flagellar hook-basal body complex protein [Planctomycetales bacterium]
MGLASSMTTALTGMSAAETQVDVAGNNLANSQTVGFKESHSVFATQFLQTYSIGSGPTAPNGGTTPRQTGLGTRAAEIAQNFSQGTIQISANPTDLAIQGDGFFIAQDSAGARLFTRNGQLKTNADNELVTVTGNRVLGYGVDDNFQLQTSTLTSLSIPLGTAATAQATKNVTLQGVLTPSGDLADTAQVIESAVLGDANDPRPDITGMTTGVAATPNSAGITVGSAEGAGGTHAEGAVYKYRFAFVDAGGTEGPASSEISVTVPAGDTLPNNSIVLNNLPSAGSEYSSVNIYRTAAGGTQFFKLATAAAGGSYTDNNAPLSSTPLDTAVLNGNYSYLITYAKAGLEDSRPSVLLGPQNIVNGRIHLQNLPTPPVPGPGDTFPAYDKIHIYRNLSTDANQFYLVAEVNPGDSYTDSKSDTQISDLNVSGNQQIDLDGPKLNSNTLLTNVVKRNGLDFEQVFQLGTLDFAARKGDRALGTHTMDITATSTVQDLMNFMQQAMGIQTSLDDPQNPIPGSVDNIPGETGTRSPGGSIQDGKIRFVSNNGVDNAVDVDLSALRVTDSSGTVTTPNLSFGKVQDAKGQSAIADFVAYDSLGIPINVRITSVLQERTDSATIYRWFADSADNSPLSGADISVGTGLITFDGQGKFVSSTNDQVVIERRGIPSSDPLQFTLDFNEISGLSQATASLAVSRQDGSSAGTLTNFTIGEDGRIRGVFSNGVTRDLGQIRMARFANPVGLIQVGDNNFTQGVNSGLPIEGNPGESGMGTVIGGAVELSNTDIGKNLINLVLATTQYRGNARVITAVQQMLDELMQSTR